MERAEAAQRYDLGAPPAELPAEVAAALEGDPPFALALERVRAARRNDPDARARIDAWNRGQDRPPVDMAALRAQMEGRQGDADAHVMPAAEEARPALRDRDLPRWMEARPSSPARCRATGPGGRSTS